MVTAQGNIRSQAGAIGAGIRGHFVPKCLDDFVFHTQKTKRVYIAP